jgi:hypothetical protein
VADVRNDQLAVMLRDFARRALQWADTMDGTIVHELTFEDTGLIEAPPLTPPPSFVTADTLQVPTSGKDGERPHGNLGVDASVPVPANRVSLPWRRGDYFFCEGCTQRRQWWKDSPPWRGAICGTCYNAELARIEAARGKKA